MTGRPFTSATGRAAREVRISLEVVRWEREVFKRANKPGDYVCPCCGEHLSGPAYLYTCPSLPPGWVIGGQREPEGNAA